MWAKFDDACYEHPKLATLSDAAWTAWSKGILWSCRNASDGYLGPVALRAIITPGKTSRSAVAELVNGGLWDPSNDGYTIHDFAHYQPASATVKAQREAAKTKKRRQRRLDEAA